MAYTITDDDEDGLEASEQEFDRRLAALTRG
jgi:hypothetical protein